MKVTQTTQQTSLFQEVAEQSLDGARLVVPAEQMLRLRDGGGNYVADFITPTEEADLLAAVDAATWRSDLQRRVQHYGYRYDYTARTIKPRIGKADSRLDALPQWVGGIVGRLVGKEVFESKPDQLIVNEYQPGQGIASHTDRDCFGPVVAAISLGDDCLMRIMPHGKNTQDAFDLVLQRRSLVVFQGQSRDVWRHGIAPRRSDQQGGRKILRQRRVSLTFRSVGN